MHKKDDEHGPRKSLARNWRVKEFFPDLDDDIHEKLRAYFVELIHFNGRINLISTLSEEEADIVHFADSILASQLILADTTAKEIYDIGTGNGLPGIIMAILAPEREFILIDKDARKIEFIKHVAARIGLHNVSVKQSRIEEMPQSTISCCVSRGFASISKSIVTLRKQCAPGARYYHLKSDSWVSEVVSIPTQVCSFWKPSLLADYRLPILGTKFFVVLTERTDK